MNVLDKEQEEEYLRNLKNFRAKVVAAEGEQKASRALKEAADVIQANPVALQLRHLQALNSIGIRQFPERQFPDGQFRELSIRELSFREMS